MNANNKRYHLRSGDLRMANIYINLLRVSNTCIVDKSVAPEARVKWVNNVIDKILLSGVEQHVYVIENLHIEANKLFLSKDHFNWIEENERACFFVFGSLFKSKARIEFGTQQDIFNALKVQEINPFYYPSSMYETQATFVQNTVPVELNSVEPEFYITPIEASTKEQKLELIIEFFDSIVLPVNGKIVLMNVIKNACSLILNNPLPFSWLERSNAEQCEWAYNYILKYEPKIYNQYLPASALYQTANGEHYPFIYYAYDIWPVSMEAKDAFESKFRNSWYQKKSRQKSSKMGSFKVTISRECLDKLDFLCAQEGASNRSRYISFLVNREYEKAK